MSPTRVRENAHVKTAGRVANGHPPLEASTLPSLGRPFPVHVSVSCVLFFVARWSRMLLKGPRREKDAH
eukprot:4982071-Pyramimonas_sp.AAC.1